MCLECAGELQDFHKFYVRIELAHKNLAALVKTEDEKDSESNYDYQGINDSHNEPEIIMEQPIPAEFDLDVVADIKTEIEEDVDSDDMPLKFTLKKGQTKEEQQTLEDPIKDPLEKSSKPKQSKILFSKAKRKLKLKTKKSNCTRKNKSNSDKDDNGTVKPENETLETKPEMEETNTSNKDDDEDDADSVKSVTKKTTKNKTKQRNNPDAETLKEYDRIIKENFQIECHLCQISLENFITLRKHFRVEHKQRGYARCCNRNFFSRSVLVDHIHLHMNPNHFKCQECGKVFSDRSTLVGHMKLHDDISKLEKCTECGKVFVSIAKLKAHMLTHLSTEKMFPCTICGKL